MKSQILTRMVRACFWAAARGKRVMGAVEDVLGWMVGSRTSCSGGWDEWPVGGGMLEWDVSW
jgi:hypothetical protein